MQLSLISFELRRGFTIIINVKFILKSKMKETMWLWIWSTPKWDGKSNKNRLLGKIINIVNPLLTFTVTAKAINGSERGDFGGF